MSTSTINKLSHNMLSHDTLSHNILSHNKSRLFKPEKLKAPRNFFVPKFIQQPYKLRPLIVEIGAGKGLHAYQYAKDNPQHDLIAIERTKNKFTAFNSLVNTVNKDVAVLDNLLAVHADAIPYCVYALPAQSVDKFFILYPNPEPKNPNQQWLNMPFFEFLLSRLKPEGKVILASNIQEYIDNTYEQSLNTWGLATKKYLIPTQSKRTHFEVKYLARGERCWELEMTKPKDYITNFDNWNSSTLHTK